MLSDNDIKAVYRGLITGTTTKTYDVEKAVKNLYGELPADTAIDQRNYDKDGSLVAKINAGIRGEDVLDDMVRAVVTLTAFCLGATDQDRYSAILNRKLEVMSVTPGSYGIDTYPFAGGKNKNILYFANTANVIGTENNTFPAGMTRDNFPCVILTPSANIGSREQILLSLIPYPRFYKRSDETTNWSSWSDASDMTFAISDAIRSAVYKYKVLSGTASAEAGYTYWKIASDPQEVTNPSDWHNVWQRRTKDGVTWTDYVQVTPKTYDNSKPLYEIAIEKITDLSVIGNTSGKIIGYTIVGEELSGINNRVSDVIAYARSHDQPISWYAAAAYDKFAIAYASGSIVAGKDTVADGENSVAFGLGTVAETSNQFVIGQYNARDDDAIFIIGNGSDDANRSNSFVVKKSGTIINDGFSALIRTNESIHNMMSYVPEYSFWPEKLTWVRGTISDVDPTNPGDPEKGADKESTVSMRANGYIFTDFRKIIIHVPKQLKVWYYCYNRNKQYVENHKLDGPGDFTLRLNCAYIRLVASPSGTIPVSQEDVANISVMINNVGSNKAGTIDLVPSTECFSFATGTTNKVLDTTARAVILDMDRRYIKVAANHPDIAALQATQINGAEENIGKTRVEAQRTIFELDPACEKVKLSAHLAEDGNMESDDYKYPLIVYNRGIVEKWVAMERGGLRGGCTSFTQAHHERRIRTAYTIKINDAKAMVISAENPFNMSSEICDVYYYDENQQYLSASRVVVSTGEYIVFPTNAKYFRFMVESTSGVSVVNKPDKVKLLFDCEGTEPEEVKNQKNYYVPQTGSPETYLWFTLDIDDKKDVYTFGRLALPYNYDPQGESVPLIVYLVGSTNVAYWDNPMPRAQTPVNIPYLTDEGFAVLCVFGWGNYYYNTYPATQIDGINYWGCGSSYNYVVPTNRNCLTAGVKWACDRYNLDYDNIFIWGKSQGGHLGLYYASYQDFPVKAIGLFAPVLDSFSQPGSSLYFQTRRALVEEMRLDGAGTTYYGSTDWTNFTEDAYNFSKANLIKLASRNMAWTNLVGGTLDENFEDAFADGARFWGEELWDDENWPVPHDINSVNIYNNYDYKKLANVPVKIWGASDDAETPYFKMVEVVKQLQNGGCHAEIRDMGRNHGGHNSPDIGKTGDATTKTSVITAEGRIYDSIALGMPELVEWFRSKM